MAANVPGVSRFHSQDSPVKVNAPLRRVPAHAAVKSAVQAYGRSTPLLKSQLHLTFSLPEGELVWTTAEQNLTGEDSISVLRLRMAAADTASHLDPFKIKVLFSGDVLIHCVGSH